MNEQVPAPQDSEIESSKFFAAVGYLNVLCFVPLLLKKESKFAQFHGKQALVLFILFFSWGSFENSPRVTMTTSPIKQTEKNIKLLQRNVFSIPPRFIKSIELNEISEVRIDAVEAMSKKLVHNNKRFIKFLVGTNLIL